MDVLRIQSERVRTSYREALQSTTAQFLMNGQRYSGRLAPGDPIIVVPSWAQDKVNPRSLSTTLDSIASPLSASDSLARTIEKPVEVGDRESPPEMEKLIAQLPKKYRGLGRPYRTYYDIFRVHTDGPARYEIMVSTRCNCFGFSKTTVDPIVKMLDSSGTLIGKARSSDLSGESPLARLTGHFDEAGDYFVMVGADNSVPGKIMSVKTGFVGTGLRGEGRLTQFPIEATPEGRYEIQVILRSEGFDVEPAHR